MIVEKRRRGNRQTLVLIPSPEEAKIVDEVLGCRANDSEGFITHVIGELRMADGYGPVYLSLAPVLPTVDMSTVEPESQEGESPE